MSDSLLVASIWVVRTRNAWLASGMSSHQDVHVQAARHDRQQEHRPEDPERAHAARQQRHGLAVAGQPAEPHQQPGEEGHRKRQPERLRQQRQQQEPDGAEVDAFGQEVLGLVQGRLDAEDEREHPEREQERGQDLADDVAVDELHVRSTIAAWERLRGLRPVSSGPRRSARTCEAVHKTSTGGFSEADR